MSIKRIIALVIIGGIVAVVGVVGHTLNRVVLRPAAEATHKIVTGRFRLLCETDFEALLDACRQLSQQAQTGQRKTGFYDEPELLHLPEPIPSLRASWVEIRENGKVTIEMGTGGLGGFRLGVYAYPEAFSEDIQGDRMLIEGLWYYDDGYMYNPDSYGKQIDELLLKSGKVIGNWW